MDNIEFDKNYIGKEAGNSFAYHYCPLCKGELIYSGKHSAFVCTKCGAVLQMEDIFLYEQEIGATAQVRNV